MASSPVIAHFCATFLKPDMQHLYRQITALQDAGEFECPVLTRSRENADAFWYWDKRVRVVPKHPLRFFRRAWHRSILGKAAVPLSYRECRDILYELKRVNAAMLHVYFGHVAVELLPVIRACPVPVVVSFHGADAGVDVSDRSEALREVFARAALVQGRSLAILDDLDRLGCSREKLRLLRTGLPPECFEAEERSVPEEGRWHLLQACRLVEKKGLDVTLRGFAVFREEFPNASLTIAGDGPLRSELQELAVTLKIRDSVRFTGFLGQEALRREYARAHVFVHPSRTGTDGNREGVPNTLVEAMASGLSVVATRHGGIPEAVEDGVHGRLVEENDVQALAAALSEWLKGGKTALRAGLAARRAAEDGFSRASQVRALGRQYREVLRIPSQSN